MFWPLIVALAGWGGPSPAQTGGGSRSARAKTAPGAVSSLKPEDLRGFETWPEKLRERVRYALSLTERNLTYKFGSADPAHGGMDCSGTIHHVLRHAKLKDVPRQSDGLYRWVEKSGRLTKVSGAPKLDDPVFQNLRPGDLLFWTGTYDTGKRALPVSHTMLYLGLTKAGKPVMFGASDGRVYEGEKRNGVSVFDFKMPRPEGKARFAGYGPPPGTDVSAIPRQPPVAPPEERKLSGDAEKSKRAKPPAKKVSKSGGRRG